MREATSEATWAAQAVQPAAVAEALRRLDGSRPGGQPGWVRTATTTVMAIVAGPDVPATRAVLRDLCAHEPVRVVVVAVADGGGDPCDAQVAVRRFGTRGAARSAADVVVRVAPPASPGNLLAVVDAVRLPNQPVVAWAPGPPPSGTIRMPELAAMADRLVVDTRTLSATVVGEVVTVAPLVPVVDLGWVALAPWRRLLAGLFAGPDFTPWLERVVRMEVTGGQGVRRLLGGWLVSRLGLEGEAVRHADGPTGVALHARSGDAVATFSLTSVAGDHVVALASVPDGPSHRRLQVIPTPSTAELLAAAVAERAPDPVWHAALVSGCPLVRR